MGTDVLLNLPDSVCHLWQLLPACHRSRTDSNIIGDLLLRFASDNELD
jgi:hypothetical protein